MAPAPNTTFWRIAGMSYLQVRKDIVSIEIGWREMDRDRTDTKTADENVFDYFD